MTDTPTENETPDIINQTLPASGTPEIYINGFQIAATYADVVMVLQRNGKNIETINLSFTLAKSMALALSEIVQIVEQETKMDIKTTNQIRSGLEEHGDKT